MWKHWGVLIFFTFIYRIPSMMKVADFVDFGAKTAIGVKAPYDVPWSLGAKTDIIWPCCGLLQVLKWGVVHTQCDKLIQPFQQQQMEMHTEYCSMCGIHCGTLLKYFQHQDLSHYGLYCIICAICQDVFLLESMLHFHITDAHGGHQSFLKALQDHCLYK